MKETIKKLQELTEHGSQKELAEFFGVTQNTLINAKKAGYKIKLHRVLPMLEHLLLVLSQRKRQEFLKEFKRKNHDTLCEIPKNDCSF